MKELPGFGTGVTLVGFSSSEFGISNVARYCLNAFEKSGIPCSFIPVEHLQVCTEKDFKYPLTVYFVNADTIKGVKQKLSHIDLRNRYEIAVWFWELEKIPDYFRQSMRVVDELWCFSDFIVQCFSRSADIPVIRMPFPYGAPAASEPGPQTSPFTFFFAFDYESDFERKNPLGVIRAFKQAFRNNEYVRLLIKSRKGTKFPLQKQRLEKESSGDSRVELMDCELARPDLLKLLQTSQVFVSLHRAEGLGLHLMDALSLGKPVIATRYGGVRDFIPEDYPGLVGYEYAPVVSEYEHYQIPCQWAEPCIEDASARMRDCFFNYSRWVSASCDCREKWRGNFSPGAFIETFKKRCLEIFSGFPMKKDSRKISPFSEFSLLGEQLAAKKNLKVFVTQTVRPDKMQRLICFLSDFFPSFDIHLFGRKIDEIGHEKVSKYFFPSDERYSLDLCPESLLQKLKDKRIDAAIIPYYNYCGKGYENVEEILNALNIPLRFGIGIEGDLFIHE